MQRGNHYNNGNHNQPSVLIVNDLADQLELMNSALSKAGYRVVTAEDGLEGFAVAKREHPDLIISDVTMPEVDGIEFCRLIRQDEELGTRPILLVSALRTDTTSVIAGLEAGADEYLEIPFDTPRLIAQASRLIERSKLEEALKDSQERYRLLFECTPQPIWVYDEESLYFLAVNESAIRTYGYSREEFLALTTKDIRPVEDVPALLIKTAAGIEGPVITSPWRHKKKDGSLIYVEITSHPLLFGGRKARLAIATDVTERKLLDEEQKRMHASIQQSAIEWRQTFNAMDFPVLIVDLEGRIRRLNKAAHEITVGDKEEIIGREVAAAGSGEPWQKAAELLKHIREDGGSRTAEVRDNVTGKTWEITLYLIHEFGSLGERAILIAQDITNRTELEASLRRSEMMSLLGSLVAGVAHEVRNPLFGISSILDAFETRFSERTEYLRYTNVLRDELARLNILMEELLEYGKPFQGELFLASLDDVVTKSLRSCVPVAEIAKVKLVNRLTRNLSSVLVDRRRLSKVFVNLIENAIQHSPHDATVVVEASEIREGNQLWLDCAVKDAGRGITIEEIPNIFEPFFSKRRGGTGLGLAIAKKIMEEHGGKLIAGNNPDGGACMIARFPVPDGKV
ncbi:MAG: PAS domain S-box protein [Acidobacteriota bacterium]|nr:PAS domain S-box protein [Acidobacteriota bacterium]